MFSKSRLLSICGATSLSTYLFTNARPSSTTIVLPDSFPRACCCDTSLFSKKTTECEPYKFSRTTTNNNNSPRIHSDAQQNSYFSSSLVEKLRSIVGQNNVYANGDSQQNIYLKGARMGNGKALAVCRPGTLQEAVDSLRAIVDAGAIVIPQGANTGLTGGSVPRDDSNRNAVVLNMRRLNKMFRVGDEENSQMLCQAGVGIHDLSVRVGSMGRESHSILGSTFLNPTVAAGVSFGSGGSQIRKGPVFTERALWCRVTDSGEVEVHNTTGFDAPTEEELLNMIDSGNLFTSIPSDSTSSSSKSKRLSSDAHRYCQSLCNMDDGKVSRCNADVRGIDPVRSEGKVLILASVHDTFPIPFSTRNVWVSCNSLKTAQLFKQKVLLVEPLDLPISCEYMNKDTIDVVDQAGRALCHSLLRFGIGPHFEKLWDIKIKIESIQTFQSFFSTLPDAVLSIVNSIFSPVLPETVVDLSKKYDHHLLIKLGDFGNDEIIHFEERLNSFLEKNEETSVAVQQLKDDEAKRVSVFRFAAAPAFRTWCVGRNLQGVSIDYSLPKNHISLPSVNDENRGSGDGVGGNVEEEAVIRCRYSHFGCNVVHEDIAWKVGVDVEKRKMKIKKNVEKEGGALPAEHGHGTEYSAPKDTRERWMRMDPMNVLNPGVGGLSSQLFYGKKST
jgi:D-lactate dehydrogenase